MFSSLRKKNLNAHAWASISLEKKWKGVKIQFQKPNEMLNTDSMHTQKCVDSSIKVAWDMDVD